ncbi:MAG: transposase [Erysipelotrichaceae bacterium]|nr:transposase [Erysipelotrichaceae bacterium]
MELLKQPNLIFSSVSRLLFISGSSVVRIFDKYTHISRLTFSEAICIDEVYTKANSFDSNYSCVFYDFITHKLIDITPSRRKDFLHSYFQCIPKSELDNVKYVCINMYMPYKQISKMYFKKAVIFIDSSHIIKNLIDSFSNLRVKLMKSYTSNSY